LNFTAQLKHCCAASLKSPKLSLAYKVDIKVFGDEQMKFFIEERDVKFWAK
jgi:hypothetical protein